LNFPAETAWGEERKKEPKNLKPTCRWKVSSDGRVYVFTQKWKFGVKMAAKGETGGGGKKRKKINQSSKSASKAMIKNVAPRMHEDETTKRSTL